MMSWDDPAHGTTSATENASPQFSEESFTVTSG
jgi:hypothetical protein